MLYRQVKGTDNPRYDDTYNCPDQSDEMCGDPCISGDFTGQYTMKVCNTVYIFLLNNYKQESGRSYGTAINIVVVCLVYNFKFTSIIVKS